MSTPLNQADFLSLVREGPGFLATPRRGHFEHIWFNDHSEIPRIATPLTPSNNLFFTLAEYADKEGGRKAPNTTRLKSFWMDIDHHPGSVYQSVEEIHEALDRFLDLTDLPMPNVYCATGNGVHLYWILDRPIPVADWLPLAQRLKQLIELHKFAADPISADAARLLRLPDTFNLKDPENPKKVSAKLLGSEFITQKSFRSALDHAESHAPRPLSPPPPVSRRKTYPATDSNISILKAMLQTLDPDPRPEGGDNRPDWMQTVWAIADLGWDQVGYELGQAWSEGGDLFDQAEFDRVWESFDPNRSDDGRRAITFGTLVHRAKKAGYTGPQLSHDSPKPPHGTITRGLVTRRASECEPKPIHWLVDQSFPLGSMVVIAGEPGLGKSQIAIRLAAAVTTGKGLPDGKKFENLGSAIILANEDCAERTIRPRLEASDANLEHVHIVEGKAQEDGEIQLVQLDEDKSLLEAKAKEIGNVRLIIIDPPSAYLGPKTDSYKDSDVRRVLTPLAKLAADTGAMVLLVVHLNKRSDGSPQQRITGSTAWTAVPRAAFIALPLEGSDYRHLVPVKNNLGDDKSGFQYRIKERLLDCNDLQIKTSCVEWGGPSPFSAKELMNTKSSSKGSALQDAIDFLEQELSTGPKPARDLFESATTEGIAKSTLRRAKDGINVSIKKGKDGWFWQLAGEPADV